MKHQVTRRVTKDVHGNNLEVKFLKGDEEMNDLTKPIDGPPRTLLTEFWYEHLCRPMFTTFRHRSQGWP